MEMKFCKACNEDHPATHAFWYMTTGSAVCKKDKLAKNRAWSQANKEKHRELVKACTEKKKLEYKKTASRYYQENKETIHARRAARIKDHLPSKLADNLRSRVKQALRVWKKEKRGSSVRDLGCTMEEFIAYIETKFEAGMSWDNYGRDTWHLDHVRPLVSFNLEDPEQFKQAMHYTNLQPLWAEENLRKGSKLEWRLTT